MRDIEHEDALSEGASLGLRIMVGGVVALGTICLLLGVSAGEEAGAAILIGLLAAAVIAGLICYAGRREEIRRKNISLGEDCHGRPVDKDGRPL